MKKRSARYHSLGSPLTRVSFNGGAWEYWFDHNKVDSYLVEGIQDWLKARLDERMARFVTEPYLPESSRMLGEWVRKAFNTHDLADVATHFRGLEYDVKEIAAKCGHLSDDEFVRVSRVGDLLAEIVEVLSE